MKSELRQVFSALIFVVMLLGCRADSKERLTDDISNAYNITLKDENLSLELVAQEPDIMTPIGMVIDQHDAIYVLESHTHSAKENYAGPKYDRIKKSVDKNNDGIPEAWMVYADSIEDGMNLAYNEEQGLFLSTKNAVSCYLDRDADGAADEKKTLLRMVRPDDVYDHAGILGVALGPDNWVYVSRGNTGGSYWRVEGSDGSYVEGYGDGGNVMRCQLDGSQVEEVAIGFWNPFDLKFSSEGRLFVSDNDPDSRGPNRLVEIVPGGDYGYQSLYGGSGIHPYQAWNAELPGTLPYAAPLGEAPCALIDASYTSFGDSYSAQLLVNVWEENNIVRVPLRSHGSTVRGEPEVLVQGDSLFHPVALATNSQGDLYISDWVMRQYPNHGKGKIWRIKAKNRPAASRSVQPTINRFAEDQRNPTELIDALATDDSFEQAIARHYLAQRASMSELMPLLSDERSTLRLQGLLTFLRRDEVLPIAELENLITDENSEIQRMALIYIGKKSVTGMQARLNTLLQENSIQPELFETFLATIRHLQPAFIEGFRAKSGKSASVKRELPPRFIEDILHNPDVEEEVKAMALPYLPDLATNTELINTLLTTAEEEPLQVALLMAARETNPTEVGDALESVFLSADNSDKVRSMALAALSYFPKKYYQEALLLLQSSSPVLQYAALKYLSLAPPENPVRAEASAWIEKNTGALSEVSLSVWKASNGDRTAPTENQEYERVDGNGNAQIGQLVYQNRTTSCTTCHKMDGWGGAFGPELSKIASSKSKRQLINAILQPSLEISPEWQGWFLVDQAGVRHTGRQIDVHEDYAELMNQSGEYDKFMHPQSYGVMERSVMPEGLHRTLTVPEFNDLITYLATLK
ncbi:PVC-type heme-binding CxxCH protein [Tunicatimonas pelagia]|uniref:PVC-type heme-binding CxxCH protein n=1 Tax=Tunicatimonas pelagia TaxID=931531 RepID=UPI00266526A8|nr:PVC-type heme-binding CxxCH protein [Tunicatimonas pelagia]WKN42085.1 dehydrogenase [Tunicatimonas pelagia]